MALNFSRYIVKKHKSFGMVLHGISSEKKRKKERNKQTSNQTNKQLNNLTTKFPTSPPFLLTSPLNTSNTTPLNSTSSRSTNHQPNQEKLNKNLQNHSFIFTNLPNLSQKQNPPKKNLRFKNRIAKNRTNASPNGPRFHRNDGRP